MSEKLRENEYLPTCPSNHVVALDDLLAWRVQAEQKKRSKARKESQKAPSRFEEEKEKHGLLAKYDEEEEEAAMLIGDQGDQSLLLHAK